MTTPEKKIAPENCPAEALLRVLAGKWKPQIFRLAIEKPLRFNALLKQLQGASKQALASALHDLENEGLLDKTTIKLKPLHIEYTLSEKGKSLIAIFEHLETIA